MSEMVERVARAIYGQRLKDLGLYESEPAEVERAAGRNWHLTSTEARAAIAAMREPTEAMVDAANDADQGQCSGYTFLWSAMIDAALQEPA